MNEGILFVSENEDGREDDNTKALGIDKDVLQLDGRASEPRLKSDGILSENKKEGAVLGKLLVNDGIVVENILSISALHKSL